jgi:hypothetical protein
MTSKWMKKWLEKVVDYNDYIEYNEDNKGNKNQLRA